VLGRGGQVVHGHLAQPEALAQLVSGADAVVHLVGIIREQPRRGQTFQRVVQEGTRAVVEAARRAGVGRMVLMSALGADPASPLPYFRTKGLAELAAQQAGFRELVIFRPSVIYGPGDGFVCLLARVVRLAPVFPLFGDGSMPLQPVAVDVVAQAVAMAAVGRLPGTAGVRVYAVTGPQVLTYRELVEEVGRALGRRVRLLPVPMGLVRWVVRWAQYLPGFPITAQQLEMLRMGSAAQAEEFYRDFGVQRRTFREGIRSWLA